MHAERLPAARRRDVVSAVRVGHGRVIALAARVVPQLDDDPRHARLASVLHPVSVAVVPDEVADLGPCDGGRPDVLVVGAGGERRGEAEVGRGAQEVGVERRVAALKRSREAGEDRRRLAQPVRPVVLTVSSQPPNAFVLVDASSSVLSALQASTVAPVTRSSLSSRTPSPSSLQTIPLALDGPRAGARWVPARAAAGRRGASPWLPAAAGRRRRAAFCRRAARARAASRRRRRRPSRLCAARSRARRGRRRHAVATGDADRHRPGAALPVRFAATRVQTRLPLRRA